MSSARSRTATAVSASSSAAGHTPEARTTGSGSLNRSGSGSRFVGPTARDTAGADPATKPGPWGTDKPSLYAVAAARARSSAFSFSE